MFRPHHPAARRASLALRLGEAVLESGGWRGVARVLEAEFGSGVRLRCRSGSRGGGPTGVPGGRSRLLPVAGLGTFVLDLPAHERATEVLTLPLAEILGLAVRLTEGLPLLRAEGEAALDPLPYAVILLDNEARLLFANAAGDDLMECRRLFLPVRPGARLRAADRRGDEVLDEAVTRILDGEGTGANWLLRRLHTRTHLAIRLRALGPANAPPGTARLLLTLRAIGAARSADGSPAS